MCIETPVQFQPSLEMDEDNVRDFCRKVLTGQYINIQDIIKSQENNLRKINIERLNLHRGNFPTIIKGVCQHLFSIRSSQPAYVIAVLGFAKIINEYYNSSTWYNQDLLIDVLYDILKEAGVEPVIIMQYCNRQLYCTII